jgi:hypothetical protein
LLVLVTVSGSETAEALVIMTNDEVVADEAELEDVDDEEDDDC